MSKPAFYAVNRGRTVGVFRTWDECSDSVAHFPGAKYKKFTNQPDAEQFAGVQMAPPSDIISSQSERPLYGSQVGTTVAPVRQTTTIIAPVQKPSVSTTSLSKSVQSPIRLLPAKNPSECDIVYSDGACKGNGKEGSIAGIGVWWGPNDPRNLSERCPGAQTNNRAELIAIARVLETAPVRQKPLLIRTDSTYSRDCFEKWIHGWVKNGWTNSAKQPVKNKELIQYISSCMASRHNKNQSVHLEHVKGHSGDIGNDGADALAVAGCWKPEIPERNWVLLEMNLTVDTDVDVDFDICPDWILNDDELMEEFRNA